MFGWSRGNYATRAEPRPSLPQMDIGEGMEQSKDIQEPQNYENDHDSIQDRLNGARHRYEAIDEPEQNTNHDQNHKDLN
jgi:hypothetical protein